jgi:predicted enzyme related to lactoylglutathione lyase
MAHRSRLGCIVIDCPTGDLGPATAFWSAALGVEGKVDDDGKYAVLADRAGHPRVLIQAVDHAARVHLDIETDDREAEAERLEALGATRIGPVKEWIVMEAPTGHRFCIVEPQRADFPGTAPVWGGDDA